MTCTTKGLPESCTYDCSCYVGGYEWGFFEGREAGRSEGIWRALLQRDIAEVSLYIEELGDEYGYDRAAGGREAEALKQLKDCEAWRSRAMAALKGRK